MIKSLKSILLPLIVLAGLACLSAIPASAQSSDALLNKLVEKGILTSDEAKQLKKETDQNFTTAYAAKSGLPEWVTSLKFSGDFRGRLNVDSSENDAFETRTRWRYRARLGLVAAMQDNLELGFRLGSGDLDGPVNPLSSYQTMQNNASKKGIFIDQVYGSWMPLLAADWKAKLSVGKLPDPFVFSEVGLGMDPDYTLEGVAFSLEHRLSEAQTVRWINGAFVLDELAATGDDPFMVASQLRLDSKWSQRVSSSVGVMWFGFANSEQLSNGAVPNVNVGNWRVPVGTNQANAVPQFKFNSLLADASATYLFDRGPLYRGKFPVKLVGSYLNNPEAPSSADNYGWSGGVFLGKAGSRGTWELAYQYKWLGANSIWEEVVDDDFGGYWATTAGQNFGRNDAAGFFTGTNVRGHVLRVSYSMSEALMLSLRWYLSELINQPVAPPGATSESQMTRLMLDVDLKF